MEESQSVTSFLRALYGDTPEGWLEIRYLAAGEKALQRWYRLGDIPFDKLRAANDAGHNVYLGVGLRRRQAGKKRDVLSIPAAWVDLDGKDFPGGKDEALQALGRLPVELQPSIVLDSGHGIHGYWLFREPVVVADSPEVVEQVESTLRGLAQHLGGDPAVADIARIMRLPGYMNVKDREHPVHCELIELDVERRFGLEDLAAFRAPTLPLSPTGGGQAAGLPKLPARALDFLARGAIEGERNSEAFAAAVQLRDAGYPEAEALGLVLGGAAHCNPPLPEREARSVVRSAYSRLPREPLAERPAQPAAAAQPDPDLDAETCEKPKPGFEVRYSDDGTPVLYRWKVIEGERHPVAIATFVPRVIAETVRHRPDGSTARTFDVQVRTACSKVVISIPPDVLADTRRFLTACLGAVGADAGLTDPGAAKYLPLAALELAPPDRPREVVYEVTGWEKIDGRLCYLSPRGGIGVPRGVKVDLSNLEAAIRVGEDELTIGGVVDEGDDVFRAGVRALLSCVLHCFPRRVMLPLLGFVFLAPLLRWSPVPDRPAVHLVGTTGARKSALLSLLQAFFGCLRFLLTWISTGNHIEIAMAPLRDMLVTVDDLKATVGDRGVGRRVLQSYADRRGRGRANRDGSLAPARYAGGLLLSAGEDTPANEASVAARSLFVSIRRDAADLEFLTEAQAAAPALATVTGRFIAWLLEQGEPSIRAEMGARVTEYRNDYRACLAGGRGVNDAGRVATSCALILAGASFLFEFLHSTQALSAEEKEAMLAETREALTRLALSQASIMLEETYAKAFLTAVRTMLETRDLYLIPVVQGKDVPPLDEVSIPSSYPASARAAGWKHPDGEIWLRPDVVLSLAGPWLTKQGKPMPSVEGLYSQLIDAGVLSRQSSDRTTYVTRIGGKAIRVLALKSTALDEE